MILYWLIMAIAERIYTRETKMGWKEFIVSEVARFVHPEDVKKELVSLGIGNGFDIDHSHFNINYPPIEIPTKVIVSKDSISQELIGCGCKKLWNKKDREVINKNEYSLPDYVLD